MSVDQSGRLAERAASRSPDTLRVRYDRATADLDPPLAIVDLDAFDRNAADMTRRAAGRPIRVATKSLRCRYLIERALATPGYRGVMCYSLPEALWLHAMGTSDDLIQGRSVPELNRRRAETIRLIQALTTLEFVNGGGTGSLESTARDASVTELTAGSGLVGPTLFDAYRRFAPEPGPAVRAAGGAKAGPRYRHAVLRRLRRLRHRHPGPAAAAVPARGPQPHRRRGRRRGPDAGAVISLTWSAALAAAPRSPDWPAGGWPDNYPVRSVP